MILSYLINQFKKLTSFEKVFLIFLLLAQGYYFYRYVFRIGSTFSPPGYNLPSALSQYPKYLIDFFFLVVLVFLLFKKESIKNLFTEILKTKFWILLLIFIIYIGISLFKFDLKADDFGVSQTLKMLFVIPFAFFTPFLVKEKGLFNWAKIFLTISVVFHALFEIVEIFLFYTIHRFPGLAFSFVIPRYGGGWDDPNGFAAFILIPLTVFILLGNAKGFKNIILVVMTILLLLTYSLTAYLGLGLILFLVFFFKRLEFKKLAIIVLTVVAFGFVNYSLKYVNIVYSNKISSSINRTHIEEKSSTSSAKNLGKIVEVSIGTPVARFHENIYLQLYLNYGLVGVGLFVLITLATIYTAFINAIKTTIRVKEYKDFFIFSFIYLTAFSLMNMTLPLYQVYPINLFVWIIIGLVWSLDLIIRSKGIADTSQNLSENESISEDLIKVAPDYKEALFYEFGSMAAASQYHKLYDLGRSYLEKGAKVLDWGAGNAHFSYWLSKNGYKAAGFGFEPKSYFGWFKDPNYEYKVGTFDEPIKISFPDKYFDGVVSVGVLEHVRETGGNEVASLKEVKRMLKSGGYFICYHLPNRLSWIEFLATLIPGKHHHLHRYTKSQIEGIVNKAGFDLVEVKRYGFLPRTQLGKVKGDLKVSRFLSRTWNFFDEILSFVFNPICQNYTFVAKKR